MTRLVVPPGSTTNDQGVPWEEIATANGCEAVEELGSQWCTDNGIDGLGICSERPPEPPPQAVSPLAALGALAPDDIGPAVADMERALDPSLPDPTDARRIAALEAVVARIIADRHPGDQTNG